MRLHVLPVVTLLAFISPLASAQVDPRAQVHERRLEGRLIETEARVGSVRHGPARTFHSNGAVWQEGEYAYDLKSGEWRTYSKEGELDFVTPYLAGNKHGVVLQYGDGSREKKGQRVVVGRRTHQLGVLHGLWEELQNDGKPLTRGSYQRGERHGEWQFHALVTGELRNTVQYACGKKVSDGGGCVQGRKEVLSLKKPSYVPPPAVELQSAGIDKTQKAAWELQQQLRAVQLCREAGYSHLNYGGKTYPCSDISRFRTDTPTTGGTRG